MVSVLCGFYHAVIYLHAAASCAGPSPVMEWRVTCDVMSRKCDRGGPSWHDSHVTVGCHAEYWPLIGQNRSCDINTGLWLVNTDHVTLILASDWSILSRKVWQGRTIITCHVRRSVIIIGETLWQQGSQHQHRSSLLSRCHITFARKIGQGRSRDLKHGLWLVKLTQAMQTYYISHSLKSHHRVVPT